MSSRARRGFTLVELLVVVAVQFVLLAATGTLLTFTLSQCGRATAAAGSLQQANAAMNDIAATVRNAYVCATVAKSGVTGLRCTMPSNAVDTDGDGVVDTYYPNSYGKNGKAAYTAGRRVWYYLSDATGAFGNAGAVLWRAVRTDDANPTASDVDRAWSTYYGGKSRFPLVASLAFTVTPPTATTTVTLVATAASYSPERNDAAANAKDTQGVTLACTLLWRTQYE